MTKFVADITSIVGEKNVSIDDKALRSHSEDQSPFAAVIPGMVVTPVSAEEISEILELCNKTRTPVMPFGSGYSFTGLSNKKGSSTLVIDMKKLDKVLEIDEENQSVTAECGIIVGNLTDKIREMGYYVNTVAVPYYKDTLGGMISGVVGGGYPLYASSVGLNNRHILGLKVVLPNGAILEVGGKGSNIYSNSSHMREANAPDITGLFVGDGGLFGIKAEATLAFYPLPPHWRSRSWLFRNFEDLWNAIDKLMSNKQLLYDCLSAFSPSITEVYTTGGESVKNGCGLVYYTHDFSEKEVASKESRADQICLSSRGVSGPDALNEFAERLRNGEAYWKASEFTELLVRRASCAYFTSKAAFKNSFSSIQSLVEERVAEARKAGANLTTAYIIHIILQNTVWADAIVYYYSDETRPLVHDIMREAHKFAATQGVTFETHGGYAADVMASCWSPALRELIKTVKNNLDPNEVLNPGLWNHEFS
jgi:FAD/FMN-containing dehydrogenase